MTTTLLRHSAQVAAAKQMDVGRRLRGSGAGGRAQEKSGRGLVGLGIKIAAALAGLGIMGLYLFRLLMCTAI